jgi:hypothetical protein
MKENEVDEEFKVLENLVKEYDLIKCFQENNLTNASTFLNKRNELGSKLLSFYGKVQEEEFKKKIVTLVINFYSQHIDFNPFDADFQYFSMTYNSMKNADIGMLENYFKLEKRRKEQKELRKSRRGITVEKQEDQEEDISILNELQETYKKINEINNEEIINQQLKKITEETKELKYDVPVANMFNFLLDFSLIIPDPNISKMPGSDENEYTLKSQMGNLYFKILEKEQNKKLTYQYDFLTSTWGEKGKF